MKVEEQEYLSQIDYVPTLEIRSSLLFKLDDLYSQKANLWYHAYVEHYSVDHYVRWNQSYWVRHQEEGNKEPKEPLHELLSGIKLIINELVYWNLTVEINKHVLLQYQICKILVIKFQIQKDLWVINASNFLTDNQKLEVNISMLNLKIFSRISIIFV